mmetsp:Transcript_60025/g.142041  ORF Transcript_60025/g.142041 Transcript_60025/m.142041 type:complete len:251 (+) Transcript_60025:448-1200(+)
MVMPGMSRLLISACLIVSLPFSLSTLRISPSVISVAASAALAPCEPCEPWSFAASAGSEAADAAKAMAAIRVCSWVFMKTPSSIGLVRGDAAVLADEQHVVGVLVTAVLGAVHAWRAARHRRHRQPDGVGAFLQQPFDLAGWHMAFDRVAAHLGGVAGPVGHRHAQARPRIGVAGVVRADLEAIGLEMPHPVLAAAAGRTLPHHHQRPAALRRDHRRQQLQDGHRGGCEHQTAPPLHRAATTILPTMPAW